MIRSWLEVMGAIVVAVAFIALESIWNGYCLMLVWNWLIVPLFNMFRLTIISAISMTIVIAYLTKLDFSDPNVKKRPPDEEWYVPLVGKIAGPALFVGFGYILKSFI